MTTTVFLPSSMNVEGDGQFSCVANDISTRPQRHTVADSSIMQKTKCHHCQLTWSDLGLICTSFFPAAAFPIQFLAEKRSINKMMEGRSSKLIKKKYPHR